jgi:hypothetical protein
VAGFASAFASVLFIEQHDFVDPDLQAASFFADLSLQQAMFFPLLHDLAAVVSFAGVTAASAGVADSCDAGATAVAGVALALLCAFTLANANNPNAAVRTSNFFIFIFFYVI